MKRKLNTVASLSVLGTLLGCAQLMPDAPVAGAAAGPARGQADVVPVKVALVPAVTPAVSSYEALYAMGRAAHGAGQLTLATQRYAQVLALAPDHGGALNALAVIHAQSDRTDEALKLFARARQLAPGAAHIHNNTGYALLRAGRLDEAELALKHARELDSLSVQTQQNLELLAQAQAERQLAVQVIHAVPSGAEDKAAPRLVAVAPNVYELTVPGTQVAGTSAATVQVAASPTTGKLTLTLATLAGTDLHGVRLEVSNDAGVTNLARRTADRLAAMEVVTARLDEAGLQLQRARQLSPGSMQMLQNLALLAQAKRKAAADIPAASADAVKGPPVGARLVAVAPQVYELQAIAPRQAVQQAKAVQTVPVTQHPLAGASLDALRGVRLEVANGAGITNLARRTADRLAGTGVITARLTNAWPYRQMKTEIQFGAGQDVLAKALQTRLPLAATTATAQLPGGVQLRLVLGHDLTGRAIAAWLEERNAQTATLHFPVPAAVTGGGGWIWG